MKAESRRAADNPRKRIVNMGPHANVSVWKLTTIHNMLADSYLSSLIFVRLAKAERAATKLVGGVSATGQNNLSSGGSTLQFVMGNFSFGI